MAITLMLAHILGDFLLQTDGIARWKSKSVWGVLAHGLIVTLVTLVMTLAVLPSWWPYAAAIGILHTLIDLLRARIIVVKDTRSELVLILLDQVAHIAVSLGFVAATGAPSTRALQDAGAGWVDPRLLGFLIGYLFLLNPAWVLIRFVVRGVWGAEAAPHLGAGEKYAPMAERILIASAILLQQYALIPLVLLPRHLCAATTHNGSLHLVLKPASHWAETGLSCGLAIVVGLILRIVL